MTLVLKSTIRAVTVYRNGALVVRRGQLDAAVHGEQPLHIPGMPLLFVSESLRLRVVGGTADAIEELAELSASSGEDPEDAATRRTLKAEKDRLGRQRQAWRDRQAATGKVTIKAPKFEDAPVVVPDVSAWLEAETLVGEDQALCAEKIQAIDDRIQEIAEALEAIRRRSQEGTAIRYTRTLATTLTPDGSGRVDVEVEYFIPGARWTPVYRIYVDTQTRQVRLWMGARVAQATGEDWMGVPIAVSTADLTRSARIPTMDSWRIGRAVPRPSRWRALPEGLDGLFADFDAAPSSPSPPQAPPPKRRSRKPSPPVTTGMRREVAVSKSVVMDGYSPGGMPVRGGGPPVLSAPPAAPPSAMQPKSASGRQKRKVKVESSMMAMASMADEEAEETYGFNGFDEDSPVAPAATEIDPGRLLDYAWLRLAAPTDRRRRGKLLPVDLAAEYRAFIEERGGDVARYERLASALKTLRKAQARIWLLGLPSGCFDVRQSSFHHRYPAGPAVDLPSDGRFHQIAILESEATCELLLRCVPRQDPRAFRFARLDNPLSRPLLPGPMQVYLDGAYTVTGRLDEVGAQGSLRLNLGVEEQVRIARNAEFHQSERGMITSTSTLDHRVHTELVSRLSGAVSVEVFERLPLEEGVEGVELSLEEARPKPTSEGQDPDGEKADGALYWRLTLAGGGSADIHYRYTINISARKELVGGNRREP